mmetsp:Transcript_16385/g.38488  ORF Transcript_16385/g.38488 Transcript_16385/m.38488 type:complete len:101 (-) Transcript_16385:14-316(-)
MPPLPQTQVPPVARVRGYNVEEILKRTSQAPPAAPGIATSPEVLMAKVADGLDDHVEDMFAKASEVSFYDLWIWTHGGASEEDWWAADEALQPETADYRP